MMSGYPSALEALAQEQQAGRLHIHPVVINACGVKPSSVRRAGTEGYRPSAVR